MTTFQAHYTDEPPVRAYYGPATDDTYLAIGPVNGEVVLTFRNPDDLRSMLDHALAQAVALCMTPDDRQAELFAEAEDAA